MRDPLPIVWGSMVMSVALFSVVGLVALVPPDEGLPWLAGPLTLVALIPAGASLALGRVIMTELPRRTVWTARWALAEAVAILGLILRFEGGPTALAAALMALGMLLVLVQFPRTAPT